MITVEQMVQREVLCCMSSLVSTLDGAVDYDSSCCTDSLTKLCEQATELASPVLDYEEAARQAGWVIRENPKRPGKMSFINPGANDMSWIEAGEWQELCETHGIEPYEWEVYEHWAVSTWFAEKLIAQGERVDTDFAGLNIWARTTTGQAISMDGCVQRIYQEMMKTK